MGQGDWDETVGKVTGLTKFTATKTTVGFAKLLTVCLVATGFFFSATQTLAASNYNLPDLGEPASASLSELQEQQLGRRFMRRIRVSQPIIDDPLLDNYIAALGRRLADQSARPEANYTFFVINDKTLNAFAAPGGFIGVNSGLILAAEVESEFAGVLAHEISHATQKHLARLIARSKELSLPAAAALVGAILLGGQAGSAALVATNAAVLSDRLAYTRDFEREADALGIRTLHRAGLDPQGMVTFFEKMQRKARVQELKVPEFLRTHPLTGNRIAEAESRVRQLAPLPAQPDRDYQFIRARVRALYSRSPREIRLDLEAELDQIDEADKTSETINTRHSLRYALALVNTQLGRFARSNETLTTLLSELDAESDKPSSPDSGNTISGQLRQNLMLWAVLDNQLSQAQYTEALETLDQINATADNPQVQAALMGRTRAKIFLKQDKVTQAYDVSRQLSRMHPENTSVHKLHAEISAQAGNQAESHESMALYHMLRDNFKSALDQLFVARKLVSDNDYSSARIEARIEEVQHAKRLLDAGQ